MLKPTLTALLLGACASVALLYLWSSANSAGAARQAPIAWPAEDIEILAGDGAVQAGELQLQLGSSGLVWLKTPDTSIDTARSSVLHLDFGELPVGTMTEIIWKFADSGKLARHTLEVTTKPSHWLALSDLTQWRGEVTTMALVIRAPSGSRIHLREISLHPPTLTVLLRALASDWTDFHPWGRASMNTNTGVTKLSPLYPVPAVTLLCAIALLAYGALLLAGRRRYRVDWRVVGAIALCCWLLLDIPWQYQLLRQAQATHAQFANKTSAEKLAVGPDAAFVALTTAAKTHIESPDARVFVASADTYTGLRTAYHLYPLNVFWAFRGRELPYRIYLHSGDYILLNGAESTAISARNDTLIMPHGHLPIEVLHTAKNGALVRLQ